MIPTSATNKNHSEKSLASKHKAYQAVAWGYMLAGTGSQSRFKELFPGMTNVWLSHFVTKNDRKKDRLQTRLVKVCGGVDNDAKVWQRFELAEVSSQVALAGMVLGESASEAAANLTDPKWLEAIFWRYVALAGHTALQIPNVQQTLSEKMKLCDTAFFIEFGQALEVSTQRSERNKRIPEFNRLAFKMAEYWVHPDAPLWLMNNEAGSRYVGHLLGMDFSAVNFAQLILRYDLKRLGRFPIRDVRISKEGAFRGFEFSKWAQPKV